MVEVIQRKIQRDLEQNQNNNNYYQLLYSLVEQRGAVNLKAYYTLERLRQDVPQLKVQLLYYGFSNNEALLKKFIDELPQQVKRIPVNNEDQNFQQFNQILRKFFKVATFGVADYDLINSQIVQQIRNLDNHIDYNGLLRKIIDQLDQLIFQLRETGHDEDLRNLTKMKKRFETISILRVPNSKKYLELVKILQPNFSDQIIDISEQKNLNQFSIKSMKEFGSFLKKEQTIIDNEDEKQMFQQIKQLSYGYTPLKKCLRFASNTNFRNFNDKFLFIISDGYPTDGDPKQYAEELKNQGFLIICFYISTSNEIDDTQLYSNVQNDWDKGAKTMFQMSSEVSNFEYPLRLVGQRTNIKLSETGRSKLFLQGNDPKQMDKFFDYFMKITNEQDALINLVGKVQIEQYINSSNQFEAKQQEGGTCYANAIAAVYQLIMAKIYDREGGYPTFEQIRHNLIQKNGTDGGNTFQIAKQTCSSFRLQCRELNQICDIKQCLHKGRPLLARFRLCEDQWDSQVNDQLGFKPFFQKFPKGILTKICKRSNKRVGGHAVVLHKYTDEYYSFINSWGTNWGDEGFFKVKDLEVLGQMEFMEVFWTKDNLTQKEKESFNRDAGQKITNYYQNYFSIIGEEHYTCPKCQRQSCIKEYQGNYYKACCPKCQQQFHPQSLGQLFVDYLYGKKI